MTTVSQYRAWIITLSVLLVVSLTVHLASLVPRADSPRGFELPEGDVAAGEVAFQRLGCQECHTLAGLELDSGEPHPLIGTVALGGTVPRPRPFGETVTAIVNPSARIRPSAHNEYVDENGASRMPELREEMTVGELVDLVTLVQSSYVVTRPDPTPQYYPYH